MTMQARTVKSVNKSNLCPLSEIKFNDVLYKFTHQIGVGNFSTVYAAKDEWMNSLVVKVYNKNISYEMWKNEVSQLKHYQCRWVPAFHGAFMHKDQLFLVMENAGVPVNAYTFNDHKSRHKVALYVAKGLLELLHHMHHQKMFHGDINPQNVLLKFSKSGQLSGVKLIDFAFCRSNLELNASIKKMAQWVLPPEYINNKDKKNGCSMDMWHLGVLLLQILKGEILSYSKEEILKNKVYEDALNLNSTLSPIICELVAMEPIRTSPKGLWKKMVHHYN